MSVALLLWASVSTPQRQAVHDCSPHITHSTHWRQRRLQLLPFYPLKQSGLFSSGLEDIDTTWIKLKYIRCHIYLVDGYAGPSLIIFNGEWRWRSLWHLMTLVISCQPPLICLFGSSPCGIYGRCILTLTFCLLDFMLNSNTIWNHYPSTKFHKCSSRLH